MWYEEKPEVEGTAAAWTKRGVARLMEVVLQHKPQGSTR